MKLRVLLPVEFFQTCDFLINLLLSEVALFIISLLHTRRRARQPWQRAARSAALALAVARSCGLGGILALACCRPPGADCVRPRITRPLPRKLLGGLCRRTVRPQPRSRALRGSRATGGDVGPGGVGTGGAEHPRARGGWSSAVTPGSPPVTWSPLGRGCRAGGGRAGGAGSGCLRSATSEAGCAVFVLLFRVP